jgi:hypothetical protein
MVIDHDRAEHRGDRIENLSAGSRSTVACRVIAAVAAGRISSWPVKHTAITAACGKSSRIAKFKTIPAHRSERRSDRRKPHVLPACATFHR